MDAPRSATAVCEGARRPTTLEEASFVRRLIQGWPVTPEERAAVKRILNIADCRIGVSADQLLAESPSDSTLIVLDIDKPGDDWVSVPFGLILSQRVSHGSLERKIPFTHVDAAQSVD